MSSDAYLALLRDFETRFIQNGPSVAQTQEAKVGGFTVRFWFSTPEGEGEGGNVLCRVDVLRLAEAPSSDLCRLLLEANNLWAGTHGGTIGLRGENVVMLSASRPVASLSTERLAAMVNAMCRDARAWRAHVIELLQRPVLLDADHLALSRA